ncbi:MAG: proline racemase family protein [Anaerolineae bacterium]|nr:proline racemase family protein [Anaerolineae bacterium]
MSMQLDTGNFLRFENQIVTLDSHVAGEPIRLAVGGLPPIPGNTINEKRLYMSEHLDHIRRLLTREPRGHRDMFAGVITEPVSDEGAFGIVFMDAQRYPYMCGHGVIGTVAAFIEMGWLESQQDELAVVVDSPSGPVHALATIDRTAGWPHASSVAIKLESAFVYSLAQRLDIPGLGSVQVDVCFAGGFFVMISVDQIGLALTPEHSPQLRQWGMAAIEAANQQLSVRHPVRTYIDAVDVAEFYDPAGHAEGRGRNFVVLGEGHVDRSPCGTGTSAKMALLHRRGELKKGQPFVNQGLLGTSFEGRILEEITVGAPSPDPAQVFPAIVPQVRGSAHLTGLHRFVVTPDDPLPEGFLIA